MTFFYKKIIFLIMGLISIWYGFLAFTKEEINNYYLTLIYYFLFFTLIIWLTSLFNAYKVINKESATQIPILQRTKDFIKQHWIAFVISTLLMTIGFYVSEPDFRILSDEAVILSDSKTLAQSKVSLLVSSTIYKQDNSQIVFSSFIDKRPLLFQFIVSLLHSITGYSPNNIFIVNFIFGILSLFLFYYLIQLNFKKVWGICGLILLASYPLFLLCASSAGFELFNLFCSLVFFLCLYKFIQNPVFALAEVLLLGLPLIGQSRYESILAFFVVIPVIFCLLPKQEYQKLSYKVLFFPLLCIPIPWLRIISDSAEWWEHENPEDIFGLRFVYDNFKHAIEFFFTEKTEYCIISAISFMAVAGLIIFLYRIFKKQNNQQSKYFSLAVFGFYSLHALARFLYVKVDFRHATASRLALIFLPLIVFFAIYLLKKCHEKLKYKFFTTICLLVISSLPIIYWYNISAKSCGYNNLMEYIKYKSIRLILEKYYNNKKDYCIITQTPFMYSPLEYSAIESYIYALSPDFLNKCINDNYFKYFLAVQIITNGQADYDIPEELDTKLEVEKNLDSSTKLIISRCVPKILK